VRAGCGALALSEFDAATRFRRGLARFVRRMHGVSLPLLFVPFLFSSTVVGGPRFEPAPASRCQLSPST
jgi:hypothetical protein